MKPINQHFRYLPCALFCCLLWCAACRTSDKTKSGDTLFERVPAAETGISFQNKVTDTDDMNIFNYHNFYNGGGVAIGDINNDGLPDIFLVSNQQANKLYLNRGNFHFEEVTAQASLASTHLWHTGVCMADVNADGWLDIYVCNAGIMPGDDNSNELYINNQDGTFTEKAKQYGLDDKGLSTHAAFFDYDHDGDLDCFVINNSNRSVENFGYTAVDRSLRDPKNGDRLYRNDNGQFVDVSEEAGIWGSDIGFALGIAVSDLNNDGWDDIYIDNDFFERDYLYINQKNGTFTDVINQQAGHISNGAMGLDIADYNNDGWADVFTCEMLPPTDYRLKTTITFEDYDIETVKGRLDYHHQFTSNSLQLNNGDNTFSEISQLAGVDATGWSWSALFFDFDNDGWKDLFVTNGLYRDLTDQDFLEYVNNENNAAGSNTRIHMTRKELLEKIPSVAISNYGFINRHNLLFADETSSLGLAANSFSSGAAYGDLDGDGDLDLVVNNTNMEAFVYRNTAAQKQPAHYLSVSLKGSAGNTFGYGASVTVYADSLQQMQQLQPSRGFQSSVEPVLHFGLGKRGKADSIVVRWSNDKRQVLRSTKADTLLTLRETEATGNSAGKEKAAGPLFHNIAATVIKGSATHHENDFIDFDRERLIPKLLSTEGPKLAAADVNNDGLTDFFMGSASGDTAKLFIQQANGTFTRLPQPAFVKDKYYEDAAAAFIDADNDGDLDIVVASGGNEAPQGTPYTLTRLYVNDGKGSYSRNVAMLPQVAVNASCVAIGDANGDGLADIFIGARSVPGRYGEIPPSALLLNKDKGTFVNATAEFAPVLLQLGMVTAAQWLDAEGDGKKELAVAGDWMPVTLLKWQNGKLQKIAELEHSAGWWNSLQVADVNHDGKPDLLAGNFGLNSRITASAEKPAKLYVGDFDNNGQTDCISVYYKKDGKAYPYHLKGELQAQLPYLKKQFLHFRDYAAKSIGEILSKEQLQKAKTLMVEQVQSCIFLNKGNGRFAMQPLPLMAQLSPVFAFAVTDLNKDGWKDLLLGGNFYGYKPQTGRMDASYGTALLAKANGGYQYAAPAATGLYLTGEVRDIIQIKRAGGDSLIMVATNDAPLKVFTRSTSNDK